MSAPCTHLPRHRLTACDDYCSNFKGVAQQTFVSRDRGAFECHHPKVLYLCRGAAKIDRLVLVSFSTPGLVSLRAQGQHVAALLPMPRSQQIQRQIERLQGEKGRSATTD